WQNGRNRFKELRRRGVPKFNAAVAAGSPTGFWRMSGHPAVQSSFGDRVTSPANGARRPASSRAKVVLPLPLAPISATRSSGSSRKSSFDSTGLPETYPVLTRWSEINGGGSCGGSGKRIFGGGSAAERVIGSSRANAFLPFFL